MAETESQKAIREAIAADQAKRLESRMVKVARVTDAPGEDCPGCKGRAGRKACGTCGI